MTTRRRRSLKQPNQDITPAMEEDFSILSEEISEPVLEPYHEEVEPNVAPSEPIQEKKVVRAPVEPRLPRKPARNIPRFSRGSF